MNTDHLISAAALALWNLQWRVQQALPGLLAVWFVVCGLAVLLLLSPSARAWLLQVAIALDQLLNALCTGWADETLSARAWRTALAGKPLGRVLRPAIDALFFWQREPGHCARAFAEEQERRQLPPQYR